MNSPYLTTPVSPLSPSGSSGVDSSRLSPLAEGEQWLLELYRDMPDIPLFQLRHKLFEKLQALIPFDWGMWWQGPWQQCADSAEQVFTYSQSERFFRDWMRTRPKQRKQLRDHLLKQPGRAVTLQQLYSGGWQASREYQKLGRHYAIEDALLYLHSELSKPGYQMFMIGSAGHCFSHDDGLRLSWAIQHLQSAFALALQPKFSSEQKARYQQGLADAFGGIIGLSLPLRKALEQQGWLVEGKLQIPEASNFTKRHHYTLRHGAYEMNQRRLVVSPCEGSLLLSAISSSDFGCLTEKQQALALAVADGAEDKQLASRFAVSEQTVRNRLSGIYKLLGVHGRAALTAYVCQMQTNPFSRENSGDWQDDIKRLLTLIRNYRELEQAREYLRRFNQRPHVQQGKRWVIEQLRPRKIEHMLDIGSGIGVDADDWLAQLSPQQLTLLDVSKGMLDSALEGREGRISAICGCAKALPFADNSFDVVHSDRLLSHIDDPISALKEMLRVCRPGGRVVLGEADFLHATVSSREPEINAHICDMIRGSIACATAYRQLMHFVKQQQLKVVASDSLDLPINSLEQFEYFSGVAATLEQALSAGSFSRECAHRWWNDVKDLDRSNAFLCTNPFHRVIIECN